MALYYPTRWFLNALRGIDSFVFALLFVAAVGLGPFAGVLGIALHTWGSTAKLWAEAIENIPSGALEAAAATGASRLKVLLFALVPDVAPSMVSVALFWWEFNVRASTVLGVVGAVLAHVTQTGGQGGIDRLGSQLLRHGDDRDRLRVAPRGLDATPHLGEACRDALGCHRHTTSACRA